MTSMIGVTHRMTGVTHRMTRMTITLTNLRYWRWRGCARKLQKWWTRKLCFLQRMYYVSCKISQA